MKIPDLVAEAKNKGIRHFGVTDHLQTPYNLPDIISSREAFLSVGPDPNFHFGVEVSCVSQWELDEIANGEYEDPVWGVREGGPEGGELAIGISEDVIARHGIEYVVGGAHWPMYVAMNRRAVMENYHRQNMFLAKHPLVDIVAHPWWWSGHWENEDGNFDAEPWFDDFGVIPQSMHDEFGAAAIENDTAVEINISANLMNPQYPEKFAARYLEYLAGLQESGVRLSIGSDCHGAHYDIDFEKAGRMLEEAGITDEFWCLSPRKE
jgi:histidinol phosphatase-like PHP family hydrolase